MKTIYNGQIWSREGFTPGQLLVEADRVIGSRPADALITGESYDACGGMIVPGYIDLHIHGVAGHMAEGGVQAVRGMAAALTRYGVTGFLPTVMTLPLPVMEQAVRDIAGAMAYNDGAQVLGCHLEGPFLNPKYKGAQPEGYMLPPTIEALEQLLAGTSNTVRHITMAAELPGAQEVARYIRRTYPHITISCGHSDASADTMTAAAEWGFSHVTHLFNGMNPLHHRAPGVAGAALWLPDYTVEVIADHIHLHPAILALAARSKPQGCLLITDAVMATGLPDGDYELGDQAVSVHQGRAVLPGTDTLAGSTLTMNRAVAHMAQQLPAHTAVAMASLYPAQRLGDSQRGHLDPGALADITVLRRDFSVQATMVAGEIRYQA